MKKKLAIEIFNAGIPVFEESKFKLHEEFPDAPWFLMKCNLRRSPDGSLTDKLIEKIAMQFVETVRKKRIKFDLVCGLPKAGDPFAEKFLEIWNETYPDKKRIVHLEKGEVGGKRRILEPIKGEFRAGETVLMIDDVVSLANSKAEALVALRKSGLIVNHCIVLMDWEIGGIGILKNEYGLEIVYEYTASEFLKVWKEACLITRSKMLRITERKDAVRQYIEKIKAK